MGFLDRFKNKKQNQEKITTAVPKSDMTLTFTSGIVANITFENGEYVDDKYLSKASIIYENPDGTFERKTVYIEPELVKNDEGKLLDNTKAYYTSMGQTPNTKAFFKQENITEELMGSDYIGRLDLTQKNPMRRYDNSFRNKYIQKFKEEKRLKEQEKINSKVERYAKFQENLVNNVRSDAYDDSCKNFDEAIYQRFAQHDINKTEPNER